MKTLLWYRNNDCMTSIHEACELNLPIDMISKLLEEVEGVEGAMEKTDGDVNSLLCIEVHSIV